MIMKENKYWGYHLQWLLEGWAYGDVLIVPIGAAAWILYEA